MRRALVVVLWLVAGCSPGVSDPVPTTAGPPSTSTTSPIPSTTATTVPATTATTVPATTTTSTVSLADTVLDYELVADLPFPVQLTARAGESSSYVIAKEGTVWHIDGSEVGDTPVLDISDQVRDEGEQGLLSIALHPEDPGLFYLHYSDVDGDTVVSEFALSSSTEADPDSERVLLQVDQPAGNHNGGMIQFTPEGTLLLGLGDGGGSADRFGNGQNPDSLLGGLVSMHVDGDPEPTVFAKGLRNPWRFWIDGEQIFIADVGQNAYEEIDIVTLGPGLNFGWPITEALHCFEPSSDCDTAGLVAPVMEVGHGDAGTCSITGGVVYRGAAMPQLDGHYFYSDYCGGYLRSLRLAGDSAVDLIDWTGQVGIPGLVTGFGVDGSGEMYVTTTEQVMKVVPAA